jgi:subtilisin family serine protease
MRNVRSLMRPMLPIVGILLLAMGLLTLAGPPAEAQQPPDLTSEDQVVQMQPARPASSVALASGALRAAVERLDRGQTVGLGIDVVGSKIRVEVLHDLESSEIRSVISGLGGTVEGEVEGVLVEALVPFDRLEALESHAGVQFVRPPLDANVPIPLPSGGQVAPLNVTAIVGEEVTKTNADDWHAAGYTGTGVKVGIIDGFDGTLWNNAVAAGELPTPAGTFCQVNGASCDIWTVSAGQQHGQAVAEVVHEMAPGAQLYLATVNTVTDLQAAVNYFTAQGVDIISRSLTARYDGPGNGTGPIATVINNAVANGIVWFNSAGNTASDGSDFGSYWRGPWADANLNGWLDFAPGDELMGFGCAFLNGVRWSDFGAANPTDYDVCVFDNPGDATPLGCSVNDQTAGAPPLELELPCNSGGTGVDYLGVYLYDPGSGTAGDVLEFMTNGGGLEYWQNPYSASGPASDTASPGALSLGAVDPPLGTAIGYYSSRGPTNDALYGGTARIKPDISAAAGMLSYTYGTFPGTSASTPTTAGAAALIIEAGVATTPSQVKTYLLNNAVVDRGAAGPDNDFGAGEIVLPQPPPTACGPGVDTDGDDFDNDIECYLPTDPLDACPDWVGTQLPIRLCPGPTCDGDDAWPLDLNVDRQISVIGDVLNFRGRIGATPGSPNWLQRLDLNGDGQISVIGDVLMYRGRIGETCE